MSPFWQKVLKKADHISRNLFGFFLRKKRVANINRSGPLILIIRPGGAGDAILLTPSVKMLAEKISGAKIHFLGEKRNIEFAKFCYGDVVEKFFTYDSLSFILFIIKNFRKYDIVIDTEQFFFLPSLFSKILGKLSFGFSTKSEFLDFSTDYFHFSYEAKEFFRLFSDVLKFLGYKTDEDFEKYFRIQVGDGKEQIDVLVAPYTTKREKSYDKFQEIIDKLSEKYKVSVVGDKKISIPELFSLVSSSRVVLCVDNAILHIAALMRKNVVAIFGPTNHIKWGYGKIVRKNLWCSPCSYFAEIPSCPRNIKCMREIDPQQVISEVEKILEGQERQNSTQIREKFFS